jgi:hypothetical protein
MNRKIVFSLLIFICSVLSVKAQIDETGLPGDHFNLHAVLDLFEKVKSVEEFEKALNRKNNEINNLDLDDDGNVDYIVVRELMEGSAHLFVLTVPVGNEFQDIATVEIEKTGKEEAIIQVIGNEEIFGEEIILEPSDEQNSEVQGNSRGPSVQTSSSIFVVNVWAWPTVRYIYAPNYVVWSTPWRVGLHPNWWAPWRPLSFKLWHPVRVKYYNPRIRLTSARRVTVAKTVYSPVRRSSVMVTKKYEPQRRNYQVSKSTRTVNTARGNQVTKTNVEVKGGNGKKVSKSTTKVNKSKERKKGRQGN